MSDIDKQMKRREEISQKLVDLTKYSTSKEAEKLVTDTLSVYGLKHTYIKDDSHEWMFKLTGVNEVECAFCVFEKSSLVEVNACVSHSMLGAVTITVWVNSPCLPDVYTRETLKLERCIRASEATVETIFHVMLLTISKLYVLFSNHL